MKETTSMIHEEVVPGFREGSRVDEPPDGANDLRRMSVTNGGIEIGGGATSVVRMGKDAQIRCVSGESDFRLDMSGEVEHDGILGMEEGRG